MKIISKEFDEKIRISQTVKEIGGDAQAPPEFLHCTQVYNPCTAMLIVSGSGTEFDVNVARL